MQYAKIEPTRGYVAMASYLPLIRRRAVLRFMRYAREVRTQLKTSAGIIGYSVRASPLSGRFWTLSAWRDTGSLMAFVRMAPHSDIMVSMKPYMGPTKFVQWRAKGSANPPTWDEGLRRLEDAPRG